jgi:hypothetical protein
VGGLLAIAGGLVTAMMLGRRDRQHWLMDAHLKATSEALAALQRLMRRIIDLAYIDSADIEADDPALVARYFDATIAWNSAMYAVLLVSPPRPAERIFALDREVDRLLDLALSRQWAITDFRTERVTLGRLAADYLVEARRETGARDISVKSIWAWDGGPEQPVP